MSPKTGRPKIDNPKNERITVRIDNKTSAILHEYCLQKDVEKAEAVRQGIMKLESDIKK